MERETGFEPATSTLARSHSTTELFPLDLLKYHTAGLAINPARLPQHASGLFRRRRIDVKPGPPLEPRHLRELRDQLHMPMVVLGRLLRERRAVDDQIVRRRFERPVHPHEHRLEEPRQRLVLRARRLLEPRAMTLWQEPRLERKARRKGRERDDLGVLEDDAAPRRRLLMDDVGEDAALLGREVPPRAVDLLAHEVAQ